MKREYPREESYHCCAHLRPMGRRRGITVVHTLHPPTGGELSLLCTPSSHPLGELSLLCTPFPPMEESYHCCAPTLLSRRVITVVHPPPTILRRRVITVVHTFPTILGRRVITVVHTLPPPMGGELSLLCTPSSHPWRGYHCCAHPPPTHGNITDINPPSYPRGEHN